MARIGAVAKRARAVSGPRSLARLLGLFDVLAKSPSGLTLAELNAALASPKSSLLNLLRPLVAGGYLNCEAGRYRLGPSIFRLASNVMSAWSFSKALRPYLEELAERTRESAYVGVLDRDARVVTYVDAIDSPHTVRYSTPVGATSPLYCTAAGRVLLAFADDGFQREYLRAVKLEARTPKTVATRKALREELARVRKSSVSVSVGEMFPEAAAVAAPIFAADGTVSAALVVGGPSARIQPRLSLLRALIEEIAMRASGLEPRAR